MGPGVEERDLMICILPEHLEEDTDDGRLSRPPAAFQADRFAALFIASNEVGDGLGDLSVRAGRIGCAEMILRRGLIRDQYRFASLGCFHNAPQERSVAPYPSPVGRRRRMLNQKNHSSNLLLSPGMSIWRCTQMGACPFASNRSWT